MRMKNPAHPGSFLKTEVLDFYELSVTKAAIVLGVGRQSLSALVNQRSSLTAEMATRIEMAFGVSRELLLRMQLSYDLAQLRGQETNYDVQPYSSQTS